MTNKKAYEKHEKLNMKGGSEAKEIRKSESASDKKMGKSAPMKAVKKGR